MCTGADVGFFLGEGAHSFFFIFLQNTSCIRKPPGNLREEWGEGAPPASSP